MRVLNKRYWPHQHTFPSGRQGTVFNPEDMERFCYDNFKTSEWRNYGFYFAFKREIDFAFFMLRWQ